MLERYADDERVWDVSGSNHLETWRSDRQDYHFSYYGGIWGWATWRRSWEAYDPEMRLWEDPVVQDRLRRRDRLRVAVRIRRDRVRPRP